MLYARATRAITNYAPIEEYCLRFFPGELFEYLYDSYPIESKHHIFYKCKKYNNYWNSNSELLNNFVIFLEFNSGAFFVRVLNSRLSFYFLFLFIYLFYFSYFLFRVRVEYNIIGHNCYIKLS